MNDKHNAQVYGTIIHNDYFSKKLIGKICFYILTNIKSHIHRRLKKQ